MISQRPASPSPKVPAGYVPATLEEARELADTPVSRGGWKESVQNLHGAQRVDTARLLENQRRWFSPVRR